MGVLNTKDKQFDEFYHFLHDLVLIPNLTLNHEKNS